MNTAPAESNYRTVLFQLILKVAKNRAYYRKIAAISRTQADKHSDWNAAALLKLKADELDRCARDMDYTFDRALDHLPSQESASMRDQIKILLATNT